MKSFRFLLSLMAILLLSNSGLIGQQVTKITGHVYDAQTKEALPFVNIIFVGTSIGTVTDVEGRFELETNTATTELQASFLGYQKLVKKVEIGERNRIDFRLNQTSLSIGEVVVTEKKVRYRNKDNPAVRLIREVLDNKNNLSKESFDYYQYNQYEKVQVDINNVTDKFKEKGIFKNFQFIFEYVDTSNLNGKVYLPIFLRENISDVYYRKNPQTVKEWQTGNKIVGFEGYVDNQGISMLLDKLYQEIDIYDNNVQLLGQQFISPLHSLAPTFYKYFILDTLVEDSHELIQVAYTPRNDQQLAFSGYMWITNDTQRAVKKIEMSILDNVNVNFVKDLKAVQEFEFYDSGWLLTKDEITIDFDISVARNGIGLFGTRTVSYKDYILNKEADEKWYKGVDRLQVDENAMEKDDAFWEDARHEELSEAENNIYLMTDSIQNIPAFKRAADIAVLLLAGYADVGPWSIGPVNTFYSFNDVEGFRGRFGGRTNMSLSKRFRFETYGAYGFKDKEWKYFTGALYSFNRRGFNVYPFHEVNLSYQKDTKFPGQDLEFIQEDNVLLSFRRGITDKMYFNSKLYFDYFREHRNRISYRLSFTKLNQKPYGEMKFSRMTGDGVVNDTTGINTTELGVHLRFAPNEQFYQGATYRLPIFNQYPVFNLKWYSGIKDVWGGEYNYQNVEFNVFKRFQLSLFGFTDVIASAGKIFGDVPFPLLFQHRANQTYSYQLQSYNMMNFLEFTSDQFVSLNVTHYWNGFIFNRIPLLKRLKWREVMTFKALLGSVGDNNDPNQNSDLLLFPRFVDDTANNGGGWVDEDGNHTNIPYIEASVGIMNVFKMFRFDLVQRITYLDNPEVSTLGVRGRFRIEF